MLLGFSIYLLFVSVIFIDDSYHFYYMQINRRHHRHHHHHRRRHRRHSIYDTSFCDSDNAFYACAYDSSHNVHANNIHNSPDGHKTACNNDFLV